MFNLFRKENRIQAEFTSFLQQEKYRCKKADEFIRMLSEAIPYVAEEVWGLRDKEITIGDNIVFQFEEKGFYLMDERNDTIEEVEMLKGQLYWKSVQVIMNYAKDMIEDIQERDAGRNRLVAEMANLTQQMKNSPIISDLNVKVFRV
ncbi:MULTISPECIES: hypothetical protein [Paenibacillus]|jgi:hypothetical protein|uniref:Immunity protein 63 domain-containing protein n=1 Tax=Paenibacillus apis TaxID=1792174 RepID=A0A920CK64_9BACL|nr:MULTISPECIES: hypothetical protein [Paenibacillus]GIO42235.1 hypothetical protein J41TS4_19930 [Paenibacillus apis]